MGDVSSKDPRIAKYVRALRKMRSRVRDLEGSIENLLICPEGKMCNQCRRNLERVMEQEAS